MVERIITDLKNSTTRANAGSKVLQFGLLIGCGKLGNGVVGTLALWELKRYGNGVMGTELWERKRYGNGVMGTELWERSYGNASVMGTGLWEHSVSNNPKD